MKKITLFFVYDGTLSPIMSDPDMAYMSNEVYELVFFTLLVVVRDKLSLKIK
jgi:hypothetical protein